MRLTYILALQEFADPGLDVLAGILHTYTRGAHHRVCPCSPYRIIQDKKNTREKFSLWFEGLRKYL